MFKKLLTRSIKTIWALFATLVVLFAVLISLLKVSLPYADNYKRDIESYLFEEFSAKVRIGSIGASWQKFGPVIELKNITLTASEQAPLDLSIRETKVAINFWKSLQEQRLVTGTFQLEGINTFINSDVFFKVRPQSQGSQLFEGLSQLFLRQIEQFNVQDSTILVRHKDGQFQSFQLENLTWLNDGNRHRGQGDVFIDGFSDNSLSIRMDLYGQRRSEIFGQIFVDAQQIDITPWLTQVIGDHIALQSTEGNFKAWSKVSDGLIHEVLIDVERSGVKWQKQGEQKQLYVEDALMQWAQKKGAWTVLANDVKLKADDMLAAPFSLQLQKETSGDVALLSRNIDLNAATQLFSLFSATKETAILANSNVQGRVSELQLLWPNDESFKGFVEIEEFSFLPEYSQGAYLGLEGLSVKGGWESNKGRFLFTGKNGELSTADTFEKPIAYDSLSLDLAAEFLNNDVVYSLPHFHLKNKDIEVNLAAQYQSAQDGHLSLFAEVQGPKQGEINNYLPKYLISDETLDYLKRSIHSGAGKHIHVVIEGQANEIPYSQLDQQGIFWVNAELINSHYQFSESWPALEQFNAVLTVDKSDMYIRSTAGRLAGIDVHNDVLAKIPLNATPSYLELFIQPEILRFSEFHELVKTTPLKDSIGDVFEFVNLSGQGKADVYLLIPLDDSEAAKSSGKKGSDYVVQGKVWPSGAGLAMPSLNIEFLDVDALVSFDGGQFSISQGTGLWQGLPVTLDVTGGNGLAGYKIDGLLTAAWQDQQMKEAVAEPLTNYFSGDNTANLVVSVNLEEGDAYQYFVDAQFDLTESSYQVTGTINNDIGEPSALNVSVIGDENNNDVFIDLDNQINFVANIPNTSGVMERVVLTVGGFFEYPSKLLPDDGFEINLNLPKVEFEPTLSFVLDLLDSLPESDESNSDSEMREVVAETKETPTMLSAPRVIVGQFGEVDILGQTWQDVSLIARPEAAEWIFDLESEAAKVSVTVPENVNQTPLNIKADYLHIKTTEGKTSEPIRDSHSLIKNIPALQARCTVCTFNGKPLGVVKIDTFSKDGSLFIEQASMEFERNKVALKGIWKGDEGAGQTTITGDVSSRYFGPWMLEWGLNTGIKQSDLSSKLSLSWEGAPYDFGFATLNGEMSFTLGEGYLSEVSDKGARIFSLFSLNSLYRKLKFDFKDVFEKGLFYNDIKGDLLVDNGVVFSENIRMDGVAGNMNMRGFTNLNDNTLDYDVTFKPKYTSSIPVIAAWLAPSSAGLSLLAGIALDKIIEKADVISEIRLKITGDLSDPNVQEVKRFTKTIDVPRPEKTEDAKESQPDTNKQKEKPADGSLPKPQAD